MILPQETNSDWYAAGCLLEIEKKLFFIKRVISMPSHAGQIGLLAGGKKVGESPIETALREFEEETQLKFEGEVIGLLPRVSTVGGKHLVPVYMKSSSTEDQFLRNIKSNGEWDVSVCVPISELSKIEDWSFSNFHGINSKKVYFFALHKFMETEGALLWGATAHIVFDFIKLKSRNESNDVV